MQVKSRTQHAGQPRTAGGGEGGRKPDSYLVERRCRTLKIADLQAQNAARLWCVVSLYVALFNVQHCRATDYEGYAAR